MKKALVLYSGGLDSRLVVRLLIEKGYSVKALHFKLPFGCCGCNLSDGLGVDLDIEIFDVTKGMLLKEYLEVLKKPKFGVGSGVNPCKDCKIFMLKKAKEYADKNDFGVIATGEVLGQRPMSQVRSAMNIIDKAIGFEVKRPLTEQGIEGRGRKIQMELAKKFKMDYPTPGGGCFLCEKAVCGRIKHLIEKNVLNDDTLKLASFGRHFWIEDIWFVVARNEKESKIIALFKNHVVGEAGKPSVYYSKESGKRKALELQNAYSTKAKKEMREKFKKVKL